MIQVFGDNLLVEIKKNKFTTSEDDENPMNPKAGTGVVVGLPEDILYFGSFNWAFDDSLFNAETASKVLEIMLKLKGKRVYWEARADNGMLVEDTSEHKLVIIKLSKIIGVDA